MKKAIFGFLIASLLTITSQAQTPSTASEAQQKSAEAPIPNPQPTANPAESSTAAPVVEWKPKMNWNGDLRVRLDRVTDGGTVMRPLSQLRARLGLKADVNEEVQAVMRLATGSSAIGTNQTLGDNAAPGMVRRSFGLDFGYIDWTFAKEAHLWAGRTTNPFWSPGKAQLVYDSDLAFEGASLKWEPQWDHSSLFLNLGSSIVREEYSAAEEMNDVTLVGAQLGYTLKAAGTWTVHVASHHFQDLQGKNIAATAAGATLDSGSIDRYKGNRLMSIAGPPASGTFLNKYTLSEAGLEWRNKFEPVEVTAYYDTVKNTGATDENTGTEYGLSMKYGRAQLGYAMIEKKADSVVGAFTDSDVSGGGTDTKGSRATLGYQLAKNSQVILNYYQAKRQITVNEHDYTRTDLDFIATF